MRRDGFVLVGDACPSILVRLSRSSGNGQQSAITGPNLSGPDHSEDALQPWGRERLVPAEKRHFRLGEINSQDAIDAWVG